MNLTKEQQQAVRTLEDDFEGCVDLLYIVENGDFENIDEIEGKILDNGTLDVEIIYYASAIEYLKENDPSLQESMEYAHDLGFACDKLNSEILASLHASEQNKDTFGDKREELEDILFPNA
jgi:hypothetical protein